jgi:hypothetical protein
MTISTPERPDEHLPSWDPHFEPIPLDTPGLLTTIPQPTVPQREFLPAINPSFPNLDPDEIVCPFLFLLRQPPGHSVLETIVQFALFDKDPVDEGGDVLVDQESLEGIISVQDGMSESCESIYRAPSPVIRKKKKKKRRKRNQLFLRTRKRAGRRLTKYSPR